MGVNQEKYAGQTVISNASCTVRCGGWAAPSCRPQLPQPPQPAECEAPQPSRPKALLRLDWLRDCSTLAGSLDWAKASRLRL